MEEEWGPRLAFACGLALAVAFRALCLEGEEKRSGGGRGEYAVPGAAAPSSLLLASGLVGSSSLVARCLPRTEDGRTTRAWRPSSDYWNSFRKRRHFPVDFVGLLVGS
jgi:hypothetical protein